MSSKSVKRLGKGTFGYVIQDPKGNAQKHFFKDCQEAALRESTIGNLMNHPHIMRIVKTNYTQNEQSITMKCAVGSVEDLIEAKYQYGQEFIQTVIKNLLSAVSYMHCVGIMHRDIKPANILIFDEKHTILTDFSLSKFECEAECHSPRCGTGHYMAPELSDCNYNMSVDDYAVGISIMELVLAILTIPKDKTVKAIELMKNYNSDWYTMSSKLCNNSDEKRLKCVNLVDTKASICVSKLPLQVVNDDNQLQFERVLEQMDVHDKYYVTLGKMISHWQNTLLKLKKNHLIEFVICAVLLCFGFCTDELMCCFGVFESYIVNVINDMQAYDALFMYACTTTKQKKHTRASRKEPFLCEIHDETDNEGFGESDDSEQSDDNSNQDSDSLSETSDCSSDSSIWERPNVDWATVISSKADKNLLKIRSQAQGLLE